MFPVASLTILRVNCSPLTTVSHARLSRCLSSVLVGSLDFSFCSMEWSVAGITNFYDREGESGVVCEIGWMEAQCSYGTGVALLWRVWRRCSGEVPKTFGPQDV